MTRHSGQQPAGRTRRAARGLAASSVAATAVALASAPLPASAAPSAHRPLVTAASGTTVWGWGSDGQGQLGVSLRNLVTNVPVKARLPRGTRIASVRGGCFHTVALTSAGTVLTWGSNSNGQLGRKAGAFTAVPAKVTFPPGTGKITAVRAGCDFSLALTSTGEVLAWGDGNIGQLGDGTAMSATTPVRVSLPPGTKVKAISAGDSFALALDTTGQVLAWGFNQFGLGDGTAGEAKTPVPVLLPPHATATAIAAGETTGLAITSTGGVLAWGDNSSGEFGDGTGMASTTPVPTSLPPGTRVRGLFAGCQDTVALTAGGQVLAWGDNSSGQLGNNSTKASRIPVRAKLPAGTKVTAIAAGCRHVLARTASGRVLAWGSNANSQIGDGTAARFRRLPARVKLPAGVRVFAVASGPMAEFSLAIG